MIVGLFKNFTNGEDCLLLQCMHTLPYTVIKSESQYFKYCHKLEELTDIVRKSKAVQEEIELLTLLVQKYDEDHGTFSDADPVEIIKSLMRDHRMKSVELARLLKVSEGLISDILHYRKGLSKEVIRKLSDHFKLSQEAFNRPYGLIKSKVNSKQTNTRRNKLVA